MLLYYSDSYIEIWEEFVFESLSRRGFNDEVLQGGDVQEPEEEDYQWEELTPPGRNHLNKRKRKAKPPNYKKKYMKNKAQGAKSK
jgi:hypothetical protein